MSSDVSAGMSLVLVIVVNVLIIGGAAFATYVAFRMIKPKAPAPGFVNAPEGPMSSRQIAIRCKALALR